MIVQDRELNPTGSMQNLTLGAGVSTLSAPSGTTKVLLHFEQACRWTVCGTAPSASVGMLQEAGTKLEITISPSRFKFAAVDAGAKISASFFQ